MSELAEFIEETTVVQEPEVIEETTAEAPEAEAVEEVEEAVTEEPEGLPTEPDKPEKTGEVPIAALLDEREKRQAAQRELDQLRKQLSEQAPKQAIPDPLDDGEAYAGHINQVVEGKLAQSRIAMSQEFMRMTHEDYDTAEAKFIQMAQENPALIGQMQAATLPAKFVYDTAKKAEKLEKLENVDEYEAKTRAELEAKIREELEAKYKTKLDADAAKAASLTPSLANQRAQGGNTGVVSVADPLETTFNR